MPRLPILESTIKQLYGTAGRCAYPGCSEPLLRWIEHFGTPVLNSRVAHITAASPGGPRYDESRTDEARRAFENLILLCLPHAEEIDLPSLAERYSVETLMQWKEAQVEAGGSATTDLPDGLWERAEQLTIGDVSMDFRHAIIDLGGRAATSPGAGGSGGGAIGPGARGGDGGLGGLRQEFTITGLEVLGEVEVEIGRPGRGGVLGHPGEAGGNSRFGAIVTPGGGRQVHSPFPTGLRDSVEMNVSSALFARYCEITNGLATLVGAGWGRYEVGELPAPLFGTMCVWVDVRWAGVVPGESIPVEVIAELVTPTGPATFSLIDTVNLAATHGEGFARVAVPFMVNSTLHDPGRHTLSLSASAGAQHAQYLDVVVNQSAEAAT